MERNRRFFIDSGNSNLKVVFRNNGKYLPSDFVVRAAYVKVSYKYMKLLPSSIHCSKYYWNIYGDFELLLGIRLAYMKCVFLT
jgi:hypothetical protein